MSEFIDGVMVQGLAIGTVLIFFVLASFLGTAFYFASSDIFAWLSKFTKR